MIIATILSLALAVESPLPVVTTVSASEVERCGAEWVPGTVRATRRAVLQARIPGVVATLAVRDGSTVEAGMVLATLDAQEIAAKRRQAAAAVAQARAMRAAATADLAQAVTDRDRTRQLLERQATTNAERDVAESRHAAATARVAAAEAAISSSEAIEAEAAIAEGYTTVRAPFSGIVVHRHSEVGELVAPGRAMFEIEDPASLRIEADIPETLAGKAALGAVLAVEVPAAGLAVQATVGEVVPAADPVSRSVRVKLDLPAANGQTPLRSGQFARVSVPVSTARGLSIPGSAVVHRGQLDAVFVVSDGRVHLRLLRLGAVDGDRIEVRAGLSTGETVVALPEASLRDGMAVRSQP